LFWFGAYKKAKVMGFISPKGDVESACFEFGLIKTEESFFYKPVLPFRGGKRQKKLAVRQAFLVFGL